MTAALKPISYRNKKLNFDSLNDIERVTHLYNLKSWMLTNTFLWLLLLIVVNLTTDKHFNCFPKCK